MKAAPVSPGQGLQTEVGVSAVDESEVQRAIEAARSALAAPAGPKKPLGKRTMLGVAAVTTPARSKAAPVSASDTWEPTEARDADPLDSGWLDPPSPEVAPTTRQADAPRARGLLAAEAAGPAVPVNPASTLGDNAFVCADTVVAHVEPKSPSAGLPSSSPAVAAAPPKPEDPPLVEARADDVVHVAQPPPAPVPLVDRVSEAAAKAGPDCIAGSSPDPLADTIAPGAMRISDVISRAQASQPAAAKPAASAKPPYPTRAVGRPPMLASRALQEDMQPTEPGREWMRALAAFSGLALLGLWAVPVALSPLTFAWTRAASLAGLDAVLALLTPMLGCALVLLGALPLPYRARAILVLLVTFLPVVLGIAGLGPIEIERGWAGWLLAVGLLVLPAALILRAYYRASVLARTLVAIGVVATVAWAFLPGGSGFLVRVAWGFAEGGLAVVGSAWLVALLGMCALSLLAFMSSATTGGSGLWGRILLAWRPGLAATGMLSLDALTPRFVVGLGLLLVYGSLSSFALAQSLSSGKRG